MKRIFREDGRTVIVAVDHGNALQVLPGLNDTGTVLEQIVRGGADAVLVNYGTAARFQDELADTGLIVRVDGGSSQLTDNPGGNLLYSVEEALKIGADAVACMGFPGIPGEAESYKNIAQLSADCREWGVPLIAEMLPGGFAPEPANTVENIKLVSRIGAELGASIIKTSFAGTKEEYKEVIDGCFVPLVILGGDQTKDLESLFQVIEETMEIGGAGVAIGRNVWKHDSPEAVTRALVSLVHEGVSFRDALKLTEG